MHLPSTQAPCVHLNPEQLQSIEDQYACLAFDAMGCRFEILLDVSRSAMNRSDCCAIAEEMRTLVLDWHQRLSIFEPTSIASLINRSIAGVEILLDSEMYALCALCDKLRLCTGGMFNVAAGTLMHSHGFRSESGPQHTLDDLDLQSSFILDERRQTITKLDDRISLDFGAIAKGFILDLIRDELEHYGIDHAFIHGGTSSILAIGHDHRNQSWAAEVDSDHRLEISGLAVGVSETQSRTVLYGKQEFGHIMDPRSMCPADKQIFKSICVHHSAAVADAYSTACCASPDLINQLCVDQCTMIAFSDTPHPVIHDPLGVVRQSSKEV